LKLNLDDWLLGNKEDLKCDLWNCEGYKSGNKYLILKSDNFEVIFRKE